MTYLPPVLWELSTAITHLDAQLDALAESADQDSGELSAAQHALALDLLMARDLTESELIDRLNNMAKYARNLQATADTLTGEIDRLAKRKASALRRIEQIKAVLLDVFTLRRMDGPVKTAEFTISVAGNGGKAPLVLDPTTRPETLPEPYRKVTYDYDKDAIRAALEAGEVLPFASIGERGRSVRLR